MVDEWVIMEDERSIVPREGILIEITTAVDVVVGCKGGVPPSLTCHPKSNRSPLSNLESSVSVRCPEVYSAMKSSMRARSLLAS